MMETLITAVLVWIAFIVAIALTWGIMLLFILLFDIIRAACRG